MLFQQDKNHDSKREPEENSPGSEGNSSSTSTTTQTETWIRRRVPLMILQVERNNYPHMKLNIL